MNIQMIQIYPEQSLIHLISVGDGHVDWAVINLKHAPKLLKRSSAQESSPHFGAMGVKILLLMTD